MGFFTLMWHVVTDHHQPYLATLSNAKARNTRRRARQVARDSQRRQEATPPALVETSDDDSEQKQRQDAAGSSSSSAELGHQKEQAFFASQKSRFEQQCRIPTAKSEHILAQFRRMPMLLPNLESFLFYGVLCCLNAMLSILVIPFKALFTPWKLDKRDFVHLLLVSTSLVCLFAPYDEDPWFLFSFWYHSVRGTSVLKLYVIFNMLEIAEKLASSFGSDALQAFWVSWTFGTVEEIDEDDLPTTVAAAAAAQRDSATSDEERGRRGAEDKAAEGDVEGSTIKSRKVTRSTRRKKTAQQPTTDMPDAPSFTSSIPSAKSTVNRPPPLTGVTIRRRVNVPFTVFLAVLSIAVIALHSFILMLQVVTLNVALNSDNYSLLALLISNNFLEIKMFVFKKFSTEGLFQNGCMDVVERIQQLVFVLIMLLRHVQSEGFGTVQPMDLLGIIAFEVGVDFIKHLFIARINNIPLSVYTRYIELFKWDVARSYFYAELQGVIDARAEEAFRMYRKQLQITSERDESLAAANEGGGDESESGNNNAKAKPNNLSSGESRTTSISRRVVDKEQAVDDNDEPDPTSPQKLPPISASMIGGSFGNRQGSTTMLSSPFTTRYPPIVKPNQETAAARANSSSQRSTSLEDSDRTLGEQDLPRYALAYLEGHTATPFPSSDNMLVEATGYLTANPCRRVGFVPVTYCALVVWACWPTLAKLWLTNRLVLALLMLCVGLFKMFIALLVTGQAARYVNHNNEDKLCVTRARFVRAAGTVGRKAAPCEVGVDDGSIPLNGSLARLHPSTVGLALPKPRGPKAHTITPHKSGRPAALSLSMAEVQNPFNSGGALMVGGGSQPSEVTTPYANPLQPPRVVGATMPSIGLGEAVRLVAHRTDLFDSNSTTPQYAQRSKPPKLAQLPPSPKPSRQVAPSNPTTPNRVLPPRSMPTVATTENPPMILVSSTVMQPKQIVHRKQRVSTSQAVTNTHVTPAAEKAPTTADNVMNKLDSVYQYQLNEKAPTKAMR